MTATEAAAYNHIRRGSARSRAELARVMNVSRPTASAVADSLISAGLLRDGDKYCGSGGRHPTRLIPCSEAFSLIGVDVGRPDRMVGVRINALGDVAGSSSLPPSSDSAAEDILRLWAHLDPEFSALGIGVAMPAGAAAGSNDLLRSLRRRLIGKYLHFTDRLQAAALSEGFRGGATPCRDYLLLSWESSVEAVICIGGRPFSGAHSLAGDLRHLPSISDNGRVSEFGDVLSSWGHRVPASSAGLAEVCASALRHALAILDPEAVVLSGRFPVCGEDFFRALSQRLQGFYCRIAPAKFGELSAARGAALQTHFSI